MATGIEQNRLIRPSVLCSCEWRNLWPERRWQRWALMKRFVLTGTPGSGKTAIIRQLEIDGFSVVEEAATDLIALAQARGITDLGRIPRLSIRFLSCKCSDRLERRGNRMRHSSTIAQLSALLPWRSTSGTAFPTNFHASWSVLRKESVYQRRSLLYTEPGLYQADRSTQNQL